MDLLNYIFSVAPMSYQAEAQEHPDHEGCHQHERCEARAKSQPALCAPTSGLEGSLAKAGEQRGVRLCSRGALRQYRTRGAAQARRGPCLRMTSMASRKVTAIGTPYVASALPEERSRVLSRQLLHRIRPRQGLSLASQRRLSRTALEPAICRSDAAAAGNGVRRPRPSGLP